MVEVLVVIAVGVILAAAIIPSLIGSLDRSRVEESAESLAGIAEAVGNMYADVDLYPGRLSHLTTPVGAGDADLCGPVTGSTYAGAAAAWAGPYLNRSAPATGLPLPIGVAQDVLTYDETVSPLLTITIDDVSHTDAVALNRAVDADDDAAAGAVRWGAVSTTGVVVLSYVRPVQEC